MSPDRLIFRSQPDPEQLLADRDLAGLVRLLASRDPDLQQRAAAALGQLGDPALPALRKMLADGHPQVRLGVIEALAGLRNPSVVGDLAAVLRSDDASEIRCACAFALGSIGDERATFSLADALKDADRVVRYGAAQALKQLGWKPADATQNAYFLIGLQEWDAVPELKEAATAPLIDLLRDRDPDTRLRIVELLGRIGGADIGNACTAALRDTDSRIRWAAVLASRRCRVKVNLLPRNLAKRPRLAPDPGVAAVLNFLFLGIGYNYIGLWWGFLVFMSYMTIIVLAQLQLGPFLPYLVTYPITAIFATQTYFMAKKIPDL